jgi:hypothetical protein
MTRYDYFQKSAMLCWMLLDKLFFHYLSQSDNG